MYTGKGDSGDTSVFGCDQRMSKSSALAEALGALDECNSFLGVCKSKSIDSAKVLPLRTKGKTFAETVEDIQQNLFIIQAEIAGADKQIKKERIEEIEKIIREIESELPPIKTFFVSGGTEIAAYLDFARTLARRAERRVVGAREEGKQKINENTLAYLNRLSSLLFALARFVNHKAGVVEKSPSYK